MRSVPSATSPAAAEGGREGGREKGERVKAAGTGAVPRRPRAHRTTPPPPHVPPGRGGAARGGAGRSAAGAGPGVGARGGAT